MIAAVKLFAKLVLGYGSVWSIAFTVGLYWFFPMDRVAEMASTRASAALGKSVKIGSLSPWRLTGVEAHDIQIRLVDGAPPDRFKAKGKDGKSLLNQNIATPATSNEAKAKRAEKAEAQDAKAAATPPLKIDRLAARARVISRLLGIIDIGLEADLLGGEVSGSVSEDIETKTREIDIEFSGVELGRIPIWRDLLGVPISGTLSGAIDMKLDGTDFAASAGTIEIKLSGVKIGKGKIPLPKGQMFPFYDLDTTADIGTIDLAILVGGDKSPAPKTVLAKITRFEQKGADISLKLDGDITLLERIGRSRPNLQLQVKLAEGFKKRAALSIIIDNPRMKRYQKEGWLGLHIGGTFGSLRPKLKKPTPPRKAASKKGSGSRPKKRRKK